MNRSQRIKEALKRKPVRVLAFEVKDHPQIFPEPEPETATTNVDQEKPKRKRAARKRIKHTQIEKESDNG